MWPPHHSVNVYWYTLTCLCKHWFQNQSKVVIRLCIISLKIGPDFSITIILMLYIMFTASEVEIRTQLMISNDAVSHTRIKPEVSWQWLEEDDTGPNAQSVCTHKHHAYVFSMHCSVFNHRNDRYNKPL